MKKKKTAAMKRQRLYTQRPQLMLTVYCRHSTYIALWLWFAFSWWNIQVVEESEYLSTKFWLWLHMINHVFFCSGITKVFLLKYSRLSKLNECFLLRNTYSWKLNNIGCVSFICEELNWPALNINARLLKQSLFISSRNSLWNIDMGNLVLS